MKILVTGGTGYIGSHTVVELQQKGHQVSIVDNLSNSSIDVVDNISEITGVRPDFDKLDLCDEKEASAFFQKNSDISAVIHFGSI